VLFYFEGSEGGVELLQYYSGVVVAVVVAGTGNYLASADKSLVFD